MVVVYLTALNLFLRTPLGRKVMNLSPEIVEIHYESAWVLWPTRVHVKRVWLRVQDANIQMLVQAETGVLDVQIIQSLLQKRFVATNVVADKIGFRLRQRLMPNEATKTKLARLPDVPGFDDVLRDGPAGPMSEAFLDTLVGVDLKGMHATNIYEVWVDEYRFSGNIQVDGGFMYQPFRSFRLDQTHISIGEGNVTLGSQPMVSEVNAEIDAEAGTLNMSVFERDALRALNAKAKLDVKVRSISFLNYYLDDVDIVRIEEGSGRLKVDAEITNGQVLAGSVLSLDTTEITLRLPFFHASGAGKVRWTAVNGRAWLDVKLRDVKMVKDSDGKVYMHGPSVGLLAQSSGLDLSKKLDLDVLVDVPDLRAPDLRFLNEFIPAGIGVHVASGSGRIKGNLEINAKSQQARGILDIDSDQIKVQNHQALIEGRLVVRGILKKANFKTGDADLSGSSIKLEDAAIDSGRGSKSRDFFVRVAADPCLISPNGKVKWDTRISLGVKSLMPIMDIVSENITLPWVARAFSDLRDIGVKLDLTVREKRVELREIYFKSGILEVSGDVAIIENGAKLQEPFGALLLKVGALPVGIGLEGKTNRAVLVDAEAWYKKERAKLAN